MSFMPHFVSDFFYQFFYSAIGAIISPDGGIRVVVTKRWAFKHHLQPGEKLYILPHAWIKEPVPWNIIPQVIREAQKFAKENK